MRKIFISAAVIGLLAACGNNNNKATQRADGFSDQPVTKEDSLYKDVMDGHDVGMAKMGKLEGAQKQIQQALDSIGKLSASKVDNAYKQTLITLKEELAKAEDGMNKWMEDFNVDSAVGDVKKRVEYLTDEKLKVNSVKEAILGSLQKADSLLRK